MPEPNQPRNKPPKVADLKYISDRIKVIKKSVLDIPFIFDTSFISLNPELEKLIVNFFSDLEFYPLIDIRKSSGFYQACLRNNYFPKRICLKLDRNHISDTSTQKQIKQIIESIGCDDTDVILLLDLEDVNDIDPNVDLSTICDFISYLKSEFDFNSFVLGAGAFPASLAGVLPWKYYYYKRKDWELYKLIIGNFPNIKYGDYTINTAFATKGPAFRGPCSIRYTGEENFLVVKGTLPDPLDEPTSEQHRKLSKLIVENEFYRGLDYSWGDKHIHRCTQPLQPNTGNPSTWRAVGTSHHIVHVVEALSKLP